MPHPIKIATCCYCGRRTMLKPTARDGHELACGSCGAPLHELKALKVEASAARAPKRDTGGIAAGRGKSVTKSRGSKKAKKTKPRKGFWKRALEEAFDSVEDAFDVVEDIFD